MSVCPPASLRSLLLVTRVPRTPRTAPTSALSTRAVLCAFPSSVTIVVPPAPGFSFTGTLMIDTAPRRGVKALTPSSVSRISTSLALTIALLTNSLSLLTRSLGAAASHHLASISGKRRRISPLTRSSIAPAGIRASQQEFCWAATSAPDPLRPEADREFILLARYLQHVEPALCDAYATECIIPARHSRGGILQSRVILLARN
jgi:hypothetical protein